MTKKIFRSLVPLVTIFAAMTACSSADSLDDQLNSNLAISIIAIHPSQTSRATDTGFEKGDKIGLYVSNSSASLQLYGNAVNNGCYSFDGSSWTPNRTYYWDEGTYNVYAYYPWQKSVNDVENFRFEVAEDQSTHNNYASSDFLYAFAENQKADNNPVSLKFSHVLSKVIIELVKGDDFEGELPDDAEVYIHNTVTTANINLTNGSSAKDNYAEVKSIRCTKLSSMRYQAIVVPQRIDSRRPIVEVMMDNISYLMEGTMSFRQGCQHTITIILNSNPQQAEIEIGGGISNWD